MNEPWLNGWKSIAAHIGVSVLTAKMLCREYGMPVRELPTGMRVALASELQDWLIGYNNKLKRGQVKKSS